MRTVRFYPEAEAEMLEAAVYYDTQNKDLGKRFLTTVQDALNRIRINPRLYPFVDNDVRGCRTKTFPYRILFKEIHDELLVMAVMHLHRDPDYWKSRRTGSE